MTNDTYTASPVTTTPVKLRWRQHEETLVTILLLTYIGYCIKEMAMNGRSADPVYINAYKAKGIYFSYPRNVLLPQVGVGILLSLVYYGINLVVLPVFNKLTFREPTADIFRRLLLGLAMLPVLSWVLAIGINLATWFAHPWWFNYGRFQLLSLLGYNDHPLESLWTGFTRALFLVSNWTAFFFLRSLLLKYLGRPGPGRAYRVLVINQCTLFAVVYFGLMTVILIGWGGGDAFRLFYFSFVLPTFVVFMVNTYAVFPRKQRAGFRDVKTIGTLLLATLLCTFPFFLFLNWELPHKQFIAFLLCWAIQLFVTTPISWLIYRERKDRILQLRGVEQELVKSTASLQFLRSQINPHFLFNALNTLYGTALREKAPDTASGIQQLGDMMRFMLHDNQLDFIPMEREIAYLQHYMALQKLRTQSAPGIDIQYDIAEASCQHPIAPMILIPFVENAFKHGISLREPSWIHLSLTCDESAIRFEIRNSVHEQSPNDPEIKQSGIGLQNVRERLEHIYPGKHRLEIEQDNSEFVARLIIHP